MDIGDETLRRTFAGLRDEELLRRWQGPLTEEARGVARLEIERRNLQVTEESLARLRVQDEADRKAFQDRNFEVAVQTFGPFIRLIFGCVLAVILLSGLKLVLDWLR